MTPLPISIINVHSLRNAGDAALVIETVKQLRQNFPGSEITLVMDDPQPDIANVKVAESLFGWVKTISQGGGESWRKRNLLLLPLATLLPIVSKRLLGKAFYGLTPERLRPGIQAYLDAALLVSKPGGFLYSSGSGLVLILIVYSLFLAWLSGKPLYIFPQSFGPLKRNWEAWLLRWILQKARVVMAREEQSLTLLTETCHLQHPRLHLIPDIAFAFDSAPEFEATHWLRSRGVEPGGYPLLGVTVINWGAQNPGFGGQIIYEEACASVIEHFIQIIGGKVIIFPQVIGPNAEADDRIPARRIAGNLPGVADGLLVVEEQLLPALLKALYGQMDAFIGTRMHSNIFALAAGVPLIAIGYMHKTRGIAETAGMTDWVLDIRTVQAESILQKFIELWEQRQAIKAHLQHSLPEIIAQASRAGKICADDFNQQRAKP